MMSPSGTETTLSHDGIRWNKKEEEKVKRGEGVTSDKVFLSKARNELCYCSLL